MHGVWGWATPQDVDDALGMWGTPEIMRAQAERQRVHRVDVRAPGETQPRWIYRISQKGADVLAQAVGATSASVSEPRPRKSGVWLREGVEVALDALRSAAELSGGRGWRSTSQLKRVIAKEDSDSGRTPGRTFLSEDIAWLVRLGYAEKRIVRRTHVYRVTQAGLDLKLLDRRP